MFEDRTHAGRLLAQTLLAYKNDPDLVVIGLPRGGVVVAYEVAKALNAPLDIVCPRKIGAPNNPEYAVGAITESGTPYLDQHVVNALHIPAEYLQKEIEKQRNIASERMKMFRKNKPPRHLEGKNVIIVDDGLATGATMRAAIQTIKEEKAKKIIVAIPVGASDTCLVIESLVDDFVCILIPPFFQAVGQFYADFRQTEDPEVMQLL